MADSNALTSRASRLLKAQTGDPRCVTMPNALAGGLIVMKDDTAVRAFSIAVQTPQNLPAEMWERIVLPNALPPIKDHKKQCTTDVLADSVTYGLLKDRRLEFVLSERGNITAVNMFPPDDDEDPSEYWAGMADALTAAKKRHLQIKQSDGGTD